MHWALIIFGRSLLRVHCKEGVLLLMGFWMQCEAVAGRVRNQGERTLHSRYWCLEGHCYERT